MQLHWFQHVPFEDLGCIAPWAEANGLQPVVTRWFAGDSPPPVSDVQRLVVMGGPMGVEDEQQYPWLAQEKAWLKQAIAAGVPMVGICLGAQLMAATLGAKVGPSPEREVGWWPVERITAEISAGPAVWPIDWPEQFDAFHWHGDMFAIPEGANALLSSAGCPNQGYLKGTQMLGLQCHLEVTHAGAKRLCEACPEDLRTGPYVQSAEQLLAAVDKFDVANQYMCQLLDDWHGLNHG